MINVVQNYFQFRWIDQDRSEWRKRVYTYSSIEAERELDVRPVGGSSNSQRIDDECILNTPHILDSCPSPFTRYVGII